MEIIKTPLKDCVIIKNTIINDNRGYFFESFNEQKFKVLTGWEGHFVQDNQSQSSYSVVRGIHFQKGEFAQAKLVRVVEGHVLDVAVDLRSESETFGQHFSIELKDDNQYQLFVPRGFGHGFSVLSPTATFLYKCDNGYNKSAEGGIHPLDKTLNIPWQIKDEDAILSEKDSNAPSFEDYLKK